MSAAKIIAQGNPQQIIGLPIADFKLPTLLHARVQMSGGAPVLVFGRDAVSLMAGTTLDTLVTLTGAGLFDFTFNGCRSFMLGTFCFCYVPNASGTDKIAAAIDKSTTNSNAGTGKLRVVTNAEGTPAAFTPVNGSEFNFSIWADLG